MIKLTLYTLLMLVLLVPIEHNALVVAPVQAHQTVMPQIASFQPLHNSPCHCKASLGLGCSISSPMDQVSCAIGFNAAGKNILLTFDPHLLRGHKRPVPLPPPKV